MKLIHKKAEELKRKSLAIFKWFPNVDGSQNRNHNGENNKYFFYDNCRNSRALIGEFLWSICGRTHKFEIHARRQRAKARNSTICYRKKQIEVIL